MTTYTLSGDLGDLLGAPLAFPSGKAARAWLTPELGMNVVDATVCVGTVALTLDATGAFTQTGVGNGNYQVIVLHYDYARRQPKRTTLPVTVTTNTVLSA